MKSLIFTIISTLFIIVAAFEAKADVIVLETMHVSQPEHSDLVSSIACNSNIQTCNVALTDFEADFLQSFLEGLKDGDIVNMSFGYQRVDDSPITQNHYEALRAQGLTVQDYAEIYDERESLLRKMIELNPGVLFVAAAGNGMPMSFLGSNGVPLGPNNKIYPAIFEYDNLIKVTAISDSSFRIQNRVEYQIASYANYSTDYVDVAAPVEVDESGTSFAAPYVSRLTREIDETVEQKISRKELKEILLKSCYIQDLDYSLELFTHYKNEPDESLIGRIQNMQLNFTERSDLIESIRPVMLVKCGGVISSEAAKKCARKYVDAKGLKDITESCLEAQVEESLILYEQKEKLKAFWSVQNI